MLKRRSSHQNQVPHIEVSGYPINVGTPVTDVSLLNSEQSIVVSCGNTIESKTGLIKYIENVQDDEFPDASVAI